MTADPHNTAQGATDDAPVSAQDHIAAKRATNRTMALILVGVIVTFLTGAFAVALLVLYGPF